MPELRVGAVVPDIPLRDASARPLSLQHGDGPAVVSFASTRCTDACPLVTAKFARLERLLAGTPVRLVEITLDPVHDTPAVLRRYAAAAGARPERWSFATGRPADVDAVARRLGIVPSARRDAPDGHTDAVAILSGSGTLLATYPGTGWSTDDVADAARGAAGLRSNPLRSLALAFFERAGAVCGGRGGGPSLAAGIAVFASLLVVLGWLASRVAAASVPR